MLFVFFSEAEAVKLFANTYFAIRASRINKLDTYAKTNDLNTLRIIDDVCLELKIGTYCNNPSFSYGSCCLQL